MYKVINEFRDLQDNDYIYEVNDIYPHDNREVPAERIEELAGDRKSILNKVIEPVTVFLLSVTTVTSLYRNVKTIHRIVLSATDNSRFPLLQYGVAGERTVQRCRQKQKYRTSCDLFVWCLKQRFP